MARCCGNVVKCIRSHLKATKAGTVSETLTDDCFWIFVVIYVEAPVKPLTKALLMSHYGWRYVSTVNEWPSLLLCYCFHS